LGDRDSFVGVGDLGTTTGFFLITIGGFGCIDSSIGFLVIGFDSIDGSDRFGLMTEAFERGSPRRLSRTDFSAYSLI